MYVAKCEHEVHFTRFITWKVSFNYRQQIVIGRLYIGVRIFNIFIVFPLTDNDDDDVKMKENSL